jgi:chromosome segregation ATPase
MSDFAFDVLGYTKNMESAGLTRQQAEAIAAGMTKMIAQQFDSLLTTRQFEAAMERIDNRFVSIEDKQDSTDDRLNAIEKTLDKIDMRLSHSDNKFLEFDARLGQLADLKSKVDLHTWMLALVIIVLVVPQLQRWFAVV